MTKGCHVRRYYGAFLALALATPALAAPPEVPKTPVLVKVGDRPAVVAVKLGKDVGVAPAFAPEDVLWFPGETDAAGVKNYLVQPYKAGVYRVVFWTKGETEFSVLVIDATGGVTPVDPPIIPPVVPPVSDPLVPLAQKAYEAAPANVITGDGEVHPKAKDKAAMRAVFIVLADSMKDPNIKTAKDLYRVNSDSMRGRIDGRLGGLGQLFAADFATIFPPQTKESYVLTQTDREAAKAKLLRYAQVLEVVK